MKTFLVAINAKYIHTNLAVRYLSTFCEVDFIEWTIKEPIETIINDLIQRDLDLVGFSCYIWNIEIIQEIVIQLKARSPKTMILLGGPEVSYEFAPFFAYPIDFIISGEGEAPFKALLDALKHHSPLINVPQLHYRQESEILSTKIETIIDLNTLPSPYRCDNDYAHRIQYIESSRGCPYHCSYCLASLEKHVRFFDSKTIQAEIRYLMEQGAKTFKFLDRTFNLRKEYALDMFQFIIQEHYPNCVFQFEITGDLLDEEILFFLNEQAPKGLIRFEIGIQSTNEETNRLVLRKQNNQKLFQNIRNIQNGQKITLHLDLIAGLPKEDYHSFVKTFNDVFALRPDELQLGFLKMLRGTKIRQESELYHYHYKQNAPYEFLSHQDLSPNDLIKIKLAEDILEKYYNSHRFEQSMTYILDTYYKLNNYAFFESFGLTNPLETRHQLHDLYMKLDSFFPNDPHIDSLIRYDYLKKQKTRPKIWYESHSTKSFRNAVIQTIITEKRLPYNQDYFYRYSMIEPLTIHPLTFELGSFILIKFVHPENSSIQILKLAGIHPLSD